MANIHLHIIIIVLEILFTSIIFVLSATLLLSELQKKLFSKKTRKRIKNTTLAFFIITLILGICNLFIEQYLDDYIDDYMKNECVHHFEQFSPEQSMYNKFSMFYYGLSCIFGIVVFSIKQIKFFQSFTGLLFSVLFLVIFHIIPHYNGCSDKSAYNKDTKQKIFETIRKISFT